MPKYYFPKGTPVLFKAVFSLMMANIFCWMATLYWGEVYAPRRPSGSSAYPFHFRAGTAFVPPLIGHYLDWGLWMHFAAMGACGAMLWFYTWKGRAVRVR